VLEPKDSEGELFEELPVRFADHFGLSRDLQRVPGKAVFASPAGQARWIQSKTVILEAKG
jgi:hypothetical protein